MSGVGVTNDNDISAADGVTTVFTYTFFAYDATYVKLYSVLNNTLTPITSGFTVTPNSDYIGGSITFSTAPAAAVGDILRRREVPYTQTTEFTDLIRYKESGIERALNTLVLQTQQVSSKVSRAVTYNEGAGVTDVTIGDPVDGSLLAFEGTTGRIAGVDLASLSVTGLDTVFTGLASNDLLKWNGTNWVNTHTIATAQIATAAVTLDKIDPDFMHAGTSSGTDTITASLTPAITSYTAGQGFYFKAGGTNTGAATINLNGLGAKAIQKRGAALAAGDITANNIVVIVYDGTQFQMVSPAAAAVVTPTGWVHIADAVASASSTLDFTTGINSTYDTYIFSFENLLTSVAAQVYARTSSNSGSTYDSGGTDYRDTSGALSADHLLLGGGGAQVTRFYGNFYLYSPSGSQNKDTYSELKYRYTAGATQTVSTANLGGSRDSASAVNAIRFYPSAGNFASGTIRLYGVSKT